MPREVHLLTPLTVFERLHKMADGRRAMVSLERDILTQLLVDHSVLVTALKGVGIKVTEPVPQRVRQKLK